MEVMINGDKLELPGKITTIAELLEHFGLAQKVVIVEQNETILEKQAHQETRVCDGDKIELVHFVGGG